MSWLWFLIIHLKQDRLVNDEDRSWFNNLLKEMLAKYMNTKWETDRFSRTMFGDFKNRDDRQYEHLQVCYKMYANGAC